MECLGNETKRKEGGLADGHLALDETGHTHKEPPGKTQEEWRTCPTFLGDW